MNAGLWNPNDLYKNGKLLSFNTWRNRGVDKKYYLLWRGIIEALPAYWKFLLKTDEIITDEIFCCIIKYDDIKINIFDLCEKKIKDLERFDKKMKMQENDFKAKVKFTTLHNVDTDEWQQIYMNSFEISIENTNINTK